LFFSPQKSALIQQRSYSATPNFFIHLVPTSKFGLKLAAKHRPPLTGATDRRWMQVRNVQSDDNC
jgi:hypothetical protein